MSIPQCIFGNPIQNQSTIAYDFDCIFLEIPIKYCIVGIFLTSPIGYKQKHIRRFCLAKCGRGEMNHGYIELCMEMTLKCDANIVNSFKCDSKYIGGRTPLMLSVNIKESRYRLSKKPSNHA